MITNSVYEIVTKRIVEELEKGVIPWQKPWFDKKINYVTRKPYRGVNLLLLPKPGEYLTWNQIQKIGGKVKKGAKSYIVTFCKKYFLVNGSFVEPTDEFIDDVYEESYEERFVLRYYRVFHIDDVEGIPSKIPHKEETNESEKLEKARKVAAEYIKREKISFIETQYNTRSYYNISADEIVLPMKRFFVSESYYYQVLFHEMTHSTGHPKRLHRFEDDKKAAAFGTKEYSKEELIAELGSAYLMSFVGLTPTYRNSAAYIQSWLSVLKNDKRFIISAAAKAEKAVRYILEK